MEQFQLILNAYPTRSFSKGEIIIYQGEVPRSVYVIKEGLVRMYNLSSDGEMNVLGFSLPYELFPTAWSFDRAQSAFFFYESAASQTELYSIPKKDFQDLLKTNKALQQTLLDHYIDAYVGQMVRLNALQYSRASEKILHTLYYLTMRFGKKLKNGKVLITMKFTQQEFADLLGLTRETTGIELNKLRKEGIVSFTKQNYVIDGKRLTKRMGETEFLDIVP